MLVEQQVSRWPCFSCAMSPDFECSSVAYLYLDLQKLVCQLEDIHERKNEVTQRQTVCINKDDLSGCLKIIHSLFDILSRLAGEFFQRFHNVSQHGLLTYFLSVGEYKCGEPVETPRMELRTAQRMLKSSFVFANQPTGQVERLWDSVVILIMEFGRKHFEIVAYNAEGEEPLSWDDVQELESLRPYIPGSCRLRLLFLSLLYFLYNLLWLSLIIAVVGGACYLIYRMKQSHQRQVNKRELRVREIVQQIACTSRNYSSGCVFDFGLPFYGVFIL